MGKVNIYKMKYEALESFYGWIDQGSEYDVAVEQSYYYNKEMDELEDIIFNITIATRFSRCGKIIPDRFKNRLEKSIIKYKNLDLEQYGLSNEEKNIFNEEVEEVQGLILMSEHSTMIQ